ncbi:MAG: hypothetical protein WC029_05325 [Sulfuricella sp.]
MKTRQSGLGLVAAIMVLVILASLAAAITSFSTGQQMASAQDVQAARTWHRAFSGTEWGLFRALKNATCDTQTWVSPDDPASRVTVICSQHTYNDGESVPGTARQVRVSASSPPPVTAARRVVRTMPR